MTTSRLPALSGLDALLQEQETEMATLRAARSDRQAMSDDRTPKRYRLGPEDVDGTVPIDVADRGADNWRERERCQGMGAAQKRMEQLTADDKAFFRRVSTPDGGAPST